MAQEQNQILNEDTGLDTYQSPNDNVHRINNDAFLQEGMYCRSNQAIPDICLENDILLITKLNYADNALHSVQVMAHPRYNTKRFTTMLLHHFDERFVVVAKADADQIREAEVDAIHARFKTHEKSVTNLQSDHVERRRLAMQIYSRRIEHKSDLDQINSTPQSNNVLELIANGNAKHTIQNLSETLKFHTEILSIETNMLAEETAKLKAILNEIIPYTEQRMLAAKVSTTEVQAQAKQLEEGIASLRLYSGETVKVVTVSEGESAPSDIPLTMVQQRLIGNLEFALFDEVRGADLDIYTEQTLLNELKNNPEFVKQIFPTERSMVLMNLRNDFKSYDCPITDFIINERNKEVFILVRNGENIYQVFSPIGSHSHASNLFPSRTALHDLFKKGNIDITVDHLWYSSAFDEREREILHYKRFLLLIAGLDHNHKLFGEFYPQDKAMEIFQPAFQDKYFHFIHDADGEGLIESGLGFSLDQWIHQNNDKIVVGSQIVVNVSNLINEYSAPSCYKQDRQGSSERCARPTDAYQVVRLQEDKDGLYVRCEVEKYNQWTFDVSKPFKTRIAIEYFKTTDILLLNNLKPSHLKHFIDNRKYRSHIFKFVGLFKFSIKLLEAQFKAIEPLYNVIYDSVRDLPNLLPMSNESLEMEIMDTINMWSTRKRKDYAEISSSQQQKALKQICDALYYRVTTRQEELTSQVPQLLPTTATPLRFTVAFDGTMFLYSTMPIELIDNRYSQHAWVHRHQLEIDKQGILSIVKTTQTLLVQHEHYEQILKDFNPKESLFWIKESKPYYTRTRSVYEERPCFKNFETKKFTLDAIDEGMKALQTMIKGETLDAWVKSTILAEYNEVEELNGETVISLAIGLLGRKIIVAHVVNSTEVIQALRKDQPYTPDIRIATISLHQFVEMDLHFITLESLLDTLNTNGSLESKKVFAPSLREIFKRSSGESKYLPIEDAQFYNVDDPFALDKFLDNPYYKADMHLVELFVGCPDNTQYTRSNRKEADKWNLYFLVGPQCSSDQLKNILKLKKMDGFKSGVMTYSSFENIIAPYHVEETLMQFLTKRSSNNKNHKDSLDHACIQANIRSIDELRSKKVEIGLDEYKDFTLYHLLDQL